MESPPAPPKPVGSTNKPDVLGIPLGISESITLIRELYTVATRKAWTSVPAERQLLFMLTEERVGWE